MKFATTLICATVIALAGCAGMQQQTGMNDKQTGATAGAAIGCLGGAFLAHIAGGKAAAGCAAGALAGGLIGYERARKDEIAAAEKAKTEVIAALASLPLEQNAKVAEVKTVEVTATDKVTREQRKYQAFDSVTLDIPLSAKGTHEHDAAMDKLKTLATRIADERGSCDIVVAMSPGDVKASHTALVTATVKTEKKHEINFVKTADASVPKGIERITVKAGKLGTDV